MNSTWRVELCSVRAFNTPCMQNRFQHREGGGLLSCCSICVLLWTVISRFSWVYSMYAYICWIQLSISNETTEKPSWVPFGYRDCGYVCQWRSLQLWWFLVANKKICLYLKELFSLASHCHPEETNLHSHSASWSFMKCLDTASKGFL